MAQTGDDIVNRITRLTALGYRGNLVARGLARGLVWRDGQFPPESPPFSSDLTTDLLDHGFQLLSAALALRAAEGDPAVVRQGLYAAAESLESAARHDSSGVAERGFHLTMAAAAFHIGGFAARAYSLFEGRLADLNLSSPETTLVHLMRRDLTGLRQTFVGWLTDEQNSDDAVLARLQAEPARGSTEVFDAVPDVFGADDVVAMALTRHFHRAMATYEHALITGRGRAFRRALMLFVRGEQASAEAKHVPLWWVFRIARHLSDDLWGNSVRKVLPKDGGPQLWTEYREQFIRMLIDRSPAEIDLWPSQLEAAKRVVDAADDLVLALPTSAGKTRIAELCILRTLANRKRVVYVTPLRALSAQIEHGLARTFRPLGVSVTSVYGASGVAHSDLETLKSAQIVVATPEKLDFAVRQEPAVIEDVGLIVLDEGHMIGLDEREIRYEMLVQRLLRRADAAERRLVCLSAVFAEGEAFDDFTRWLRSDAPGTAVRSTWRPTRQRPGVLRWNGYSGKLEFEVEGERPYVTRFVDSEPAAKGRKTAFPNDAQEYLVASTKSFLARGQTVLIYCPEKRSVEPMAAAFLKAAEQGYFSSTLTDTQLSAVEDAARVGEEWLGSSHTALQCLKLGLAVHHGSLPRQFLGEVEHLLRKRTLPVCVCSPTLAQGLDLSFSVLLFKSIYRNKATIPPKEFANVVGRVGRAFVDLDGLYVYPVFEKSSRRAAGKIGEFQRLTRQARQRQLESGVRELIGHIINVLQTRLGCDAQDLADYVLNVSSSWSVPEMLGDSSHTWLEVALNELDTAILGVVDVLDLPVEEVADYLDNCLQSSYWQRRLKHSSDEDRELQAKVFKGRAKWLWTKTNPESRRAYFASGVGQKAGAAIEAAVDQLRVLLQRAEQGLASGNVTEAAQHVAAAAAILYAIRPFAPDDPIPDLPLLLTHWLSGAALSAFPDKSATGFIQDHVVYRLVWAVEAARLHLEHLQPSLDEPPGGTLALCLTYGVPSAKAALLMQGGIRSRPVAASAAAQIAQDFADFEQLKNWVRQLRAGQASGPVWTSEYDQAEWNRFLARFSHRDQRARKSRRIELLSVWNFGTAPKHKSFVRVSREPGASAAVVASVSSRPLGTTTWPPGLPGTHLLGRVRADRASIRAVSWRRKQR